VMKSKILMESDEPLIGEIDPENRILGRPMWGDLQLDSGLTLQWLMQSMQHSSLQEVRRG
jgi:hypothetical protein